MCAMLCFFLTVCNKPHANPTIIYENIKEIHILAVGGTLEFPMLSHVLLRRKVSNEQALPQSRKLLKRQNNDTIIEPRYAKTGLRGF